MRRALLPAVALALLLAVALILASALARPASAPLDNGAARVAQVDASAYPEITLYVAVNDDLGRPRTGLGRTDFAVREDGVPVEVVAFSGGGAGAVTTALVVDRSGSMEDEGKLEGAQAAATAFVDLLRPGDRAALVAFDDEVELAEGFTADQAALRAAVEALRADGGTALYDAVVAGVELLRDAPGRRLLVVLSDGQDCSTPFDSCPDEYGSRHTLAEALAYAQAAGQPVVVVGLGDRARPGDDGIDETLLARLADETGGRYFYAPQATDLARLYTDLAGAVQQEYQLTYVSPRPFYDGTRRDIQIQAGASVAAGAYTERHLINVVANPLVGVTLLTPLGVLLALPGVLRARRASRRTGYADCPEPGGAASSGPSAPALAASGPAGPALSPSRAPVRPAPAPESSTTGRRCVSCDAPLRETARFCSACGAAQPEGAVPTAGRQ